VATIRETCSVCSGEFDIQFRYQMEERDGGFSFYCTQKCLEKSQRGGAGAESDLATCDACAKRFSPDLVSQVLYVGGRRNYACSLGCRSQLLREANGVRLGDIAAEEITPPANDEATPAPASRRCSYRFGSRRRLCCCYAPAEYAGEVVPSARQFDAHLQGAFKGRHSSCVLA